MSSSRKGASSSVVHVNAAVQWIKIAKSCKISAYTNLRVGKYDLGQVETLETETRKNLSDCMDPKHIIVHSLAFVPFLEVKGQLHI